MTDSIRHDPLEDASLALSSETQEGNLIRPRLFTYEVLLALGLFLTGLLVYFYVRPSGADDSTASQTFRGHSLPVEALALAPDGPRFVSGSTDRTLRIRHYDHPGARPLLVEVDAGVNSLAFRHDGQVLFAGCQDGLVRRWETTTWEEQLAFRGHSQSATTIAVSPDGKWLASAGREGAIALLDIISGQERAVLRGHSGGVTRLVFSPTRPVLVSTGMDGTVRLWNVTFLKEEHTFRPNLGPVTTAAYSPDGTMLAVAGCQSEGSVVWDAGTTERLHAIPGHGYPTCALAFSPDSRRIAMGDLVGRVSLRELPSRSEVATWAGHRGCIKALAYSRDGKALFTGGDDGVVRIWEMARLGRP